MFSTVRILLVGGLIGKVAAIGRELLAAWLFGTGPIASAFRMSQAAFLIPLHGFLSDAVNAGFAPVFSRLARADGLAEARALLAAANLIVLCITLPVSVVLIAFAEPWIRYLAPGFSAYAVQVSVDMLRVLALAMPAYGAVAVLAAADLVIAGGRITAARNTVQSAGLIVGTVLAWLFSAPSLIPAGFVASYLGLVLWCFRTVRTLGYRVRPQSLDWKLALPALREIGRALRWLVLVPCVMQVMFVVERRVTSVIGESAVPALDYARLLADTILTLVAMPFGLAGLATMATMDTDSFKTSVWKALNVLCMAGLAASFLLALNSRLIVQIMFERGAFDATSTKLTATLVAGLGVGLGLQMVGYSGLKFLSAKGRNGEVIAITLVAAGCAAAINLGLSKALGLAAVAASLAAFGILVGSGVLWRLQLVPVFLKSHGAYLVAYGVVGCLIEALSAWLVWPLSAKALVSVAFVALVMVFHKPYAEVCRAVLRNLRNRAG